MKASKNQNSSVPAYKLLLLKARQMQQDATASLYDRLVLLDQIFTDSAFRADNGNCDDPTALEILSDLTSDTALSFAHLRCMLKMFSDRQVWESKRLQQLHNDWKTAVKNKAADAKTETTATAPGAEPTKPVRASLQDVREAKQEAKQEAIRARVIGDELTQAKKRIADLESDNMKLREENALLREQLTEERARNRRPMRQPAVATA